MYILDLFKKIFRIDILKDGDIVICKYANYKVCKVCSHSKEHKYTYNCENSCAMTIVPEGSMCIKS